MADWPAFAEPPATRAPRRPMIAVFAAAALGLMGARSFHAPASAGLVLFGAAIVVMLAFGAWIRLRRAGTRAAPGDAFGSLRVVFVAAALVAVAGAYGFWLAALDTRQRTLQDRFPAGERVTLIAEGVVHSAPVPLPDRSRPVTLDVSWKEPPSLVAPRPMFEFERTAGHEAIARSVFELTVHEYRGGDEPWNLRGAGGTERIRVFVDETWPDLRLGQRVAVPIELNTLWPPTNPGQFDFREHLRHQGISRQAMWRFHTGADVIAEPSPWFVLTPRGFTGEVRRRMILFAHERLGEVHSALLLTLTLGLRSALVPELRDSFAKTGTVHLLVISGLHVGILVLLLEGLLLLLRVPLARRAVAMIVLLLLFRELTGGQVAVTRAVTMACVFYAGWLTMRRPDLLNVLAAAAVVVVTLNPHELFNAGFHLSFLAVFWLAMLGNRRRPAPTALDAAGGAGAALGLWTLGAAGRALLATFVVLVGLAPLLAHNFHLVSPSALLVNVVALPVVVLVLAMAIPLLLGIGFEVAIGVPGLLAVPLGFAAHVAAAGQSMLLQSVFLVAREWWSHVVTPPPNGFWIVPYQLWLFAFATRRHWGLSVRRWLLAGGLLALAFVYSGVRGAAPPPAAEASATMLDVGIGRCVVLRAPEGGVVVVDPGNRAQWSAARRLIAPYLWSQGIHRIDVVVLTDLDADTVEEVANLAELVPLRRILVSRRLADSLHVEPLRAALAGRRVEIIGLSPGDRVFVGGATLQALGPRAASAANAATPAFRESPGTMAVLWEVPHAGAESARLLLPGPSEALELDAVWQQLDAAGIRRVDAVALPYDRPGDPMLIGWLRRLAPNAVLHGHYDAPDTPVAAALEGAQVLTTGEVGAIRLHWPRAAESMRISRYVAEPRGHWQPYAGR